MRRMGWLAAWPAGLILAVVSVVFARSDPGYAFAVSGAAIALELLAGGALIASGLLLARRGGQHVFAALLIAGGCGWFLLEWNNPGVDSALAFTVGLVMYAAAPPFIAHALLIYPSRSLSALDRVAVSVGYVGALLLVGLLPALVDDPAGQGCSQCPQNLLLVHGNSALYQQLNRTGIYLGLVWSVLVLGLLLWRLARSTVAMRRLVAPVLIAGCAYVGLVAGDFAASVSRGYLSNDPIDRRIWFGQAAALIAVALALAWSWRRGRRTRSRLARLVVDLSTAPSPGGLEQALARSLEDPSLRLAYPLASGRHVDPEGRERDPGPASTALLRGGTEVARLTHTPGLLDDPVLVDALAATASLALDHERLRAQVLAHLAELRSSRARIVATGDRERRRLERDLHDGAQQRLVALTLELGVLRARLLAQPDPDRALLARVFQADSVLRASLDELRVLAAGIFPAVLAEEGVAAAIETLAEDQPGRIRIEGLPDRRLDAAVESAAYWVIGETVRHAVRTPVSVDVRIDHERLVVEIDTNSSPINLEDLEDRVGALDGTVELQHANGHARIRAEIPCAS